jgi:orotidine-5'-phosphate decarboxylase
MISARERLIVALDVSSPAEAQTIVGALGDSVQTYKVGMQLYTAAGPSVVRDLIASGKKVFLDLKYHDIPNTVGAAVRQAAQLGVSMLTVHASGGSKILKAATEAKGTVQILAVTVLTSMNEDELHESGVPNRIEEQVGRLAALALRGGCDGVVSSAREVKYLRARLGNNFLIVTPGVRPAGTAHGDQARVITPAEAISLGATHIVVGRPITAAADPASEAEKILREIA